MDIEKAKTSGSPNDQSAMKCSTDTLALTTDWHAMWGRIIGILMYTQNGPDLAVSASLIPSRPKRKPTQN